MTGAAQRKRFVAGLFAVGVALGLWVSLHYAFAIWGPESDTAEPYVLWQGVLRHGLGFLRTFRYTPDNWLLSSVPAFFVAFAALGDEVWVVIAVGWAIFAAAVLVAALIVRRAAGGMAAAAAAAVLLLSNRGALGGVGFLANPMSHGASLLWGLLALYGAIRWCETAAWPWVVVVVTGLVVAGVSDPWAEAAFTLPLGCAAVWLIGGRGQWGRRKAGTVLAVAVGAALVADHTRLFGLVGFVVPAPVAFASGAARVEAVRMLGRFGAAWFNVLPGRNAAYPWDPGAAEAAISLAPLLAAAVAAVVLALRQFGRAVALDLLLLAGVVSCGGMVVSYVVLDTPKLIETGRYFMAASFLLVMLFAAAVGRAWGSLPPAGRLAAAAYGVLLAAAGLASGPSAWTMVGLRVPDEHGVGPFAAFLEGHGLRYGYGPYWGAEASAVAWVTRGRVVVRPVAFDPATGRVSPRELQTSPLWYTPADVPPGQRTAFLAITHGDDGCADVAVCASAAERKFGPPQQRLQYRDAAILVWDYPLFGADPAVLAAHGAPLPVDASIDFTTSGGDTYVLDEGWSQPEVIGTWTDAAEARILLHLPPGWTGPARVSVEASAFVPPRARFQEVIVSFAGRRLARWEVAPGPDRTYAVTVPEELLAAGSGVLAFGIPGAVSPQDARVSDDSRKLGINVRAMRIERAGAAAR